MSKWSEEELEPVFVLTNNPKFGKRVSFALRRKRENRKPGEHIGLHIGAVVPEKGFIDWAGIFYRWAKEMEGFPDEIQKTMKIEETEMVGIPESFKI